MKNKIYKSYLNWKKKLTEADKAYKRFKRLLDHSSEVFDHTDKPKKRKR